MGVLLGLLSALCYGVSDFAGGIGGRRSSTGAVALIAQPLGLVAALIALAVFPGHDPTTAELGWGALSGVGSGAGTVTLYRGLSVGRMGVVSPLSAVLSAVLPATAGLVAGERPPVVVLAGIALAVPAVALVSWQRDRDKSTSSGIGYGLAAGAGFALLFIALDHAGTGAGAWPLVPGQAVAVLVVIPFALRWSPRPRVWRAALVPGVVAGALGGAANLLFLAATGAGELTVVAVLTALYPGITVLLARLVLGERWQRLQLVGLLAAAIAITLITVA
ncbi:MAG: EamA family transporter [Sciscionella sp.]